MTTEQFSLLKEEYINNIKRFVTENGGLFPHLSVFADVNKKKIRKIFEDDDSDKPALLHIPLPDKYTQTDEGKELFIKNVFPELAKEIKENFTPNAIAWASEAWVRKMDKEDAPNGEIPDNWKELPIQKEVIIITIESESSQECLIFNINRNGKQIDEDGNLVDTIELTPCDELSGANGFTGRFSGLFSKFKTND